MTARQPLAVWIYGVRVALLERARAGMRLTYRDEALDRFPLNTPLLSVSMPLAATPYGAKIATPFFDGLLPEGESRQMIAYDFGVPVEDSFALLEKLGRECAGALVIQPATDPPPAVGAPGAQPLSDPEVGDLIRRLHSQPLGVNQSVRVSLAGMQEKLLLTRLRDGGWALPIGGMPSTHILKPEPPLLPGSVENEAFCLGLARALGRRAASAEVAEFSGRKVLVVERFDRRADDGGGIERIHQEDMCQALGFPSRRKYEQSGGPSLRQIAALVRRWTAASSGLGELDALLRQVVLNVVIGNADAHGKNLGLLHHSSGAVALAPIYDVMATTYYPGVDQTLGMYVGAARQIGDVTLADMTREAKSWGMPEARALKVIGEVLERVPEATAPAARAVPGLPPAVAERALERSEALLGPKTGPGAFSPLLRAALESDSN
ncbi:MAG: HipA domain-containing protein [Candidatus Dormibacteria bacterium]